MCEWKISIRMTWKHNRMRRRRPIVSRNCIAWLPKYIHMKFKKKKCIKKINEYYKTGRFRHPTGNRKINRHIHTNKSDDRGQSQNAFVTGFSLKSSMYNSNIKKWRNGRALFFILFVKVCVYGRLERNTYFMLPCVVYSLCVSVCVCFFYPIHVWVTLWAQETKHAHMCTNLASSAFRVASP